MKRGEYQLEDFSYLVLNFLCWLFVVIISLALIATVMTTYHIWYVPYFDTYLSLQLSLATGMLIWGVKFLIDSKKYPRNRLYAIISLVLSVLSMFFIYTNVI